MFLVSYYIDTTDAISIGMYKIPRLWYEIMEKNNIFHQEITVIKIDPSTCPY